MRTLDYIHLDASAVSNVVASLKQLLADYQVFYTNLRGFHWKYKMDEISEEEAVSI